MNIRTLAMLALAAALALGCGQSTPTSTGGPGNAQTGQPSRIAETKDLPVSAEAKPEVVVAAFLEAVRRGDKENTTLLLTDKARTETHSKKMLISPESAPNTSFKVAAGEILPQNPNGAHVSCVWSEKMEDGSTQDYDVVWVLRKQTDGWRIAGMATELEPGQPPQYLNFEDPEDMLQKKEEAAKQADAFMATAPETTGRRPTQGPSEGVQTPNSSPQTAPSGTNKLRR